MDIYQIRFNNYQGLIEKFSMRADQKGLLHHGQLRRFGEFAGLSPRYLSHINNQRKKIGDAFARKMESGFGMPQGWLDNIHENTTSAYGDEKAFIDSLCLQAYTVDPVGTKMALLALISNQTRPQKGLLASAVARRRGGEVGEVGDRR